MERQWGVEEANGCEGEGEGEGEEATSKRTRSTLVLPGIHCAVCVESVCFHLSRRSASTGTLSSQSASTGTLSSQSASTGTRRHIQCRRRPSPTSNTSSFRRPCTMVDKQCRGRQVTEATGSCEHVSMSSRGIWRKRYVIRERGRTDESSERRGFQFQGGRDADNVTPADKLNTIRICRPVRAPRHDYLACLQFALPRRIVAHTALWTRVTVSQRSPGKLCSIVNCRGVDLNDARRQ